MFSGLSINTSADVLHTAKPPTRSERASVWLSAIVFGEEEIPHPGMHIKRRLSSMDTAEAPDRLLLVWTDQGKTESSHDLGYSDKLNPESADVHADLVVKSASLFISPGDTAEYGATEVSHTPVSPTTRIISRTDSSPLSPGTIAPGQRLLSAGVATGLALGSEAIDFMNGGESYEVVVSAILRSFNTSLSSQEFCLRVGYGGNERIVENSEEPIKEFFRFKDLGLNPRLILCRDVN